MSSPASRFGGVAEAEDDDCWMETQGGSLDAEIARREEEVRQHASGSRKAAADRGPQHQQAGVPSRDGEEDSGSDSGSEGQGGASTQERVQVSAFVLRLIDQSLISTLFGQLRGQSWKIVYAKNDHLYVFDRFGQFSDYFRG